VKKTIGCWRTWRTFGSYSDVTGSATSSPFPPNGGVWIWPPSCSWPPLWAYVQEPSSKSRTGTSSCSFCAKNPLAKLPLVSKFVRERPNHNPSGAERKWAGTPESVDVGLTHHVGKHTLFTPSRPHCFASFRTLCLWRTQTRPSSLARSPLAWS